MCKIIEIETGTIDDLKDSKDCYKSRLNIAALRAKEYSSVATIYVLAYNNLDKTRRCIESILNYTTDIDYDLILVDNGSTDGTLDYFKSIDFKKKLIIHITDNKGIFFPQLLISPNMYSRYIIHVANDMIVTSNWLTNLIKVAESDIHIGLVNPMSSNVSNLQQVDLEFSSYEDMQNKAKDFNVSDPRKWQERLRIVTLGTLYKKECALAVGFPLGDIGFSHNFGDDDYSFRVRRAGYKIVLAGDTWIHHDDYKSNISPEQAQKMNEDLAIGRKNFHDKYYGIDAWDDVNNYIPEYINELKPNDNSGEASVLGIDVKCGTPILEVKNNLKRFDIFDTDCYGYTTESKYLIDLQTVCGKDNVFSGEIKGFQDYYISNQFTHIVIGNDINTYSEPFRLIKAAYGLLKQDGQLFFSLQNTSNIFSLAYSLGNTNIHNPSHSINYSVEEFLSLLLQEKYDAKYIAARGFEGITISNELIEFTKNILQVGCVKNINETMFRLTSQRYFFVITK